MVKTEAVLLHQVRSLAFGPGVSERVATDVVAAGARSALIVTTPPIRKAADRIAQAIEAGGRKGAVWDDCAGEPSIGDFDD